jgi:hypothetical protein
MNKTIVAAVLVVLVAVLVPSFAAADPGSAVQADLTQLSGDVKTAHDTLVPDLGAVIAAAQAGDVAGAKAAIQKARGDAKSLLPAVQKDRRQLRTDLEAARAAGVTGLAAEVKAAVQVDHPLVRDIRQARRQALLAILEARHAKS